MAKMTAATAIAIAAGAALAGVACLPQTHWVIASHFDVLRGRSAHWGSAASMAPPGTLGGSFPPNPEFSLYAYADQFHSDAAAKAHVLRLGGGPKQTAEETQRLLKIAAEGARLEPDNALFPVMEAAILHGQQRTRESEDALLRAAAGSRFDFYAVDEARVRYDAEIKQHGYRGQRARQHIFSSLAYPCSGQIHRLAAIAEQIPDGPRKVRLQAALLKVAVLLGERARTPQEFQIGAQIAMRQPASSSAAAARTFDSRARAAGVEGGWASRAALFFKSSPATGLSAPVGEPRTALLATGAIALASLLVLPLFALGCALVCRARELHPQVGTSGPEIAAVLAGVAAMIAEPAMWMLLSVGTVFFSLAAATPERIGRRIGVAGSAVLLAGAFREPAIGAPAVAYLATVLVAIAGAAKWVPIVATFLGVVAAGAALASTAGGGSATAMIVLAVSVALSAATLVASSARHRLEPAAVATLVVLCAVYIGSVGSSLDQDRQLRASIAASQFEAERLKPNLKPRGAMRSVSRA